MKIRIAAGALTVAFLLLPISWAQTEGADSPSKVQILTRLNQQVADVTNYCEMVERYAARHLPIQVAAWRDDGVEKWEVAPHRFEFPSRSLPAPSAEVWLFEGKIVAMSFHSKDVQRGFEPARYCFWPNGRLARFSVEATRQEVKMFPGVISSERIGIERIYAADGRQLLTSWKHPRRLFASEVTHFIYPDTQSFFDVHQLPFFSQLVPQP